MSEVRSVTPRRYYRLRQAVGYTLVEMMIAVAISTVLATFMMGILLFSTRANAVLVPQMARQEAAGQTLGKISDLVRNAKRSTINLKTEGQMDFVSVETPDVISRVQARYGGVYYYPNAKEVTGGRRLGLDLESLTFERVGTPAEIIEIVAVYKYRKFRGYNDSDGERMNGTFSTRVWPRNG